MITPVQEAQVKVPPKYIVTFMFRGGEVLQLPYENEDRVKQVLLDISTARAESIVVVHSAEPAPSVINLNDLICATPSLVDKTE